MVQIVNPILGTSMKSEIGSAVMALLLSCSILLMCGCSTNGGDNGGSKGTGGGKTEVPPPPPPPTEAYRQGLELGAKHQSEQVGTYRVLIALIRDYPKSSDSHGSDRTDFFKGFRQAYAKANVADKSAEVEGILKQSLSHEASIYQQAFAQGGKHVTDRRVTNAQIARMIRRYLYAPERELACKAGYIEGYVRAHSDANEGNLYTDALWMYLSLRPPDRL